MTTHDFIIERATASEFRIEVSHDKDKIRTCSLLGISVAKVIVIFADSLWIFFGLIRWKSVGIDNDEVSSGS